MVKTKTIIKHRIIMLFVLALARVLCTGCDKGSLGVKTGAIQGYVIDAETNQPISEVLIRGEGLVNNGRNTENKTTYTDGDGSFIFGNVSKGTWSIYVEKYGYELVGGETSWFGEESPAKRNIEVNNGETVVLTPIKMTKTASGTKGILKGYPIDALTGRPLTNFTITQETPTNQRKTKTFDSAATFRDTGWTGLEGGEHEYTITCNNYQPQSLSISTNSGSSGPWGSSGGSITIGKSPVNLGTIMMQPLTVDISGTLRNVPGYVLDSPNIVAWAESAGKVVASYTEVTGEAGKGTIIYTISRVPVTAGSVSIKCKIKGYDVITINSSVGIASANPGGTIAGIDLDLSTQEPIKADLRVIVLSSEPDEDGKCSFKTGHVARVYVQSGGNDIVPYADVTSVNYGGEVTISGVITGYPLKVIAVNQNEKFHKGEADIAKIQEGTDIYPVTIDMN
ncbi:MAG: carboxypeptidase regulatory-like domain-containing protein [Candidatus Riflebacteria bacterium]|nr:carboxypeptidase regulatory-like domain-containing protein [Candidatus Riflebacteria bacterium]